MRDKQSLFDMVEQSPSTFVEMIFHHDRVDIEPRVLDHDDDVVLASNTKSFDRQDLFRALYQCLTEPDTDVLVVTPNPAGAQGTIMLAEDEFDRSSLTSEQLGVDEIRQNKIFFDNGSRIIAHAAGNDETDRVRGYSPDLLVVNCYEEEGYKITEDTIKNVLLPMARSADVWVLDTVIDNDNMLTRALLNDGALVKYMYGPE